MGLKDLFITPIYLVIFTVLAYMIRPYVTNRLTRKYFMPALLLRFAGAIMLGVIYQFYYGFGGDTLNFFRQATIIYEAIWQDPSVGFQLLTASAGEYNPETFAASSRIYWYRSSTEYFLIKIIGFLSVFTLNTYTAIALFFAVFSFAGSWLMYKVFQERFPISTKYLSYAILFIPSCIFWGSGVLKDTISLGALGILVWGLNKVVYNRSLDLRALVLLLIAAWLIYSIKVYILLCFIPAAFIWWYFENTHAIKEPLFKALLIPLFLFVAVICGYLLLESVAGTSSKYSLDAIAERAYITSYDIRFYSGKNAGSGYYLGIQDGTWNSLIKLIPSAINVSLFRPYLWEIRNPLMVLSAIEAAIFLILSALLVLNLTTITLRKKLANPLLRMCVIFSLTFAFAVGVSTYNFGSLSRYKIPLLPFYGAVLAVGFTKDNVRKRLHTF
ncbi:MAG: hypothetical protein AAF789_05750 [Bacteroidota bacterium]